MALADQYSGGVGQEVDQEILKQALKNLHGAVARFNQTWPPGTYSLSWLDVYDHELKVYPPGKNWPMPDKYPNPKIYVAKSGLMNWQCSVLYPMTKGLGTGQVILSLSLQEMANLINQTKADEIVAKAVREKYFLIVPPSENMGRVTDQPQRG